MDNNLEFQREKVLTYITNYLKSYSPQTLEQIKALNENNLRLVILQTVYNMPKHALIEYIEELFKKQN